MDSNDEDETDEAEVETELKRRLEESRTAAERKEKRKSRFEPEPQPREQDDESPVRRSEPRKMSPQKSLTKEETLAEMMFVMKRTLTEVLLEVTNEEIENVARETLEKLVKRNPGKAGDSNKRGRLVSGRSVLGTIAGYGSDRSSSSSGTNTIKLFCLD